MDQARAVGGDNDAFACWLVFAEVVLTRRGRTLATVADPAWDVLFEGGVSPQEAAAIAINEHELNSPAPAMAA